MNCSLGDINTFINGKTMEVGGVCLVIDHTCRHLIACTQGPTSHISVINSAVPLIRW